MLKTKSKLLLIRFYILQVSKYPIYTFTEHIIHSMAETMEHRIIRSKHSENNTLIKEEPLIDEIEEGSPTPVKTKHISLVHEHYHIPRPPRHIYDQPTVLPRFLYGSGPKVQSNKRRL